MSKEVRKVADEYLRAPKQVQVNRKEMLPSSVEQYYYPTMESNKPEVLCKLIEAAEDFYGLIFCQTKALVSDLTQHLIEKGYKVDSLHGDKDQNSRERTMQAFRDRKVRILVCTDVAARGLDVKDITHVINYSLPRELDNYVHRIGRTARSGKTGIAMNLVTASHRRLIWQIENMTKTRMLEGKIPTRREIGAKKVGKLLPSFTEQTFHTRAIEIMSDEWKAALATMSAEEVAARFMSLMMPEIFIDREPKQSAPRMDRREERGDRPARGFREDRAERPARGFRGDRPQREARHFGEDRPFRAEGRPFRGDDRPARSERPFREESSFAGEREARPFRAERTERPARSFHTERPQHETRPQREERPLREARHFGGDRPFRGADRPARGERPFRDERPAREERKKVFAVKASDLNTAASSDAPPMNRKARRAQKFAHLTGAEFPRKSGTNWEQSHT
jgi:ATP-dependent RNA helicase DeaD